MLKYIYKSRMTMSASENLIIDIMNLDVYQ